MSEIKQLPTSVINKIAAGEVIERPASIVKELMENSVDAGAKRVDVTIEKGGSELVRVADSGCGISPDQLTLAVTSHATSKIRDADDLFSVDTLGFRGEALASISEVSQFVIRSRPSGQDAGFEFEVNGGQHGEIVPCGCPPGTIIEVRNLFFNTPVRRKFLKTNQTEMGHIGEAFTRIALGNPDVHFTLTHNNKTIHELPQVESWSERIGHFFGEQLRDSLIAVENEGDDIKLNGFVANPTQTRGNNRMQYLFLNGRHIRDRALQHALGEAYRGLILTGRFPIAFVRLEMPADWVDVNVHPAKLEVRFQEGGRLYSQLLGTLRNRFLSTDLTAQVESVAAGTENAIPGRDVRPASGQPAPHLTAAEQRDSAGGSTWQPSASPSALEGSHPGPVSESQSSLDLNYRPGSASIVGIGGIGSDDHHADDHRPDDHLPGTTSGEGGFPFSSAPGSAPGSEPGSAPGSEPNVGSVMGRSGGAIPSFRRFESGQSFGQSSLSSTDSETDQRVPIDEVEAGSATTRRTTVLQIQNRYLVTEGDEGMIVIDQHALHERILYEQLREKVLSGKMEMQRMLVPEPVSLSPAEAATAVEAADLLAEIGIEIEPFGGDTVLISSFPTMLGQLRPAEVLRSMIDQLISEGKNPDRRDTVDELLHMMSCKAAIKAGDRLSSEEMEALVEHRHLCQDSHHCPHGRPTTLVFSRQELDKHFKRI